MLNQTEKKVKVLLVEDEKMLSDMYVSKFTKEDLPIITASDGAMGLEMAKKELPDLILLDIIIPKLDGFAVLRELRAAPETKSIPVIMLTNLGQDEDVKKGKELGASDYIIKSDQTPAQVVAKVKGLLHQHI